VSTEEQNMQLMQTLDDAWNAQDVEVFRQRHKSDVVVRWPGKPPTHGIEDHVQESIEFWRPFLTSTSTTDPTGSSLPPGTGPARSPTSPAP
jgi:ketosteroid isomerase-like protein